MMTIVEQLVAILPIGEGSSVGFIAQCVRFCGEVSGVAVDRCGS